MNCKTAIAARRRRPAGALATVDTLESMEDKEDKFQQQNT